MALFKVLQAFATIIEIALGVLRDVVKLVAFLVSKPAFWGWAGASAGWIFAARQMPEAAQNAGVLLNVTPEMWTNIQYVPPAVFGVIAAVIMLTRKGSSKESGEKKDQSDTLGSARWDTELARYDEAKKVQKNGYEPGDWLPVGRHPETNRILKYHGDGHLMTCASTGSGKGVGAVIPALLTRTGSVLTIDPKGENFAVTARQRKRLESPPVVLDPFNQSAATGSRRAAFNPLALIDPGSPSARSDARRLARQIVPERTDTSGTGRHFDEEARNLLRGLILHARTHTDPRKRNLPYVRKMLTVSAGKWENILSEMSASDAAGGAVREVAHIVDRKEEKERANVLSTARRELAFAASTEMEKHLTVPPEDSLNLRALKSKARSVFLVVPPSRIAGNAAYLRLVIGAAVDGLERTHDGQKVLFLLDEVAQLGNFRALKKGLSIARGQGAQFWLIYQNLPQIKNAYGRDGWESVLSACRLQQFFGVADGATAEYASKRAGNATVMSESGGQSAGESYEPADLFGRQNESARSGWSEQKRRIIDPAEVTRLGETEMLLAEQGQQPAKVGRLRYFADREFPGLWDLNPTRPENDHTFA